VIIVERQLGNLQLYHGKNKLHFDEMKHDRFVLDQHTELDFYSLWVDMSFHSDTWF